MTCNSMKRNMADTMATQIPHTMRALALSRYCKPADYDVATLPTPEISQPDELLIKVHAASVNPIDVKLASG
jgi:NADPH:quinone reductase-like Zn-dependent oxidoreductase